MAQPPRRPSRRPLRRLRWRLRGAWLWPTFVVATIAEAALLRWLPVAGDGGGWIGSLLLAGCLNVAAVAALGTLGGRALRRLRPDLPRVVADDRAGLVALATVGAALLAGGLAHRPGLLAERAAFEAQSQAVRRWLRAHGDAYARAHADEAEAVLVDDDLFRTCLPGPDPKRWLCVVVDTSRRPPLVRRDPNRESNASQLPRAAAR